MLSTSATMHTPSASPMHLRPPHQALYESLALGEREAERLANREGYATSRLRSKKDKNGDVRKVCCVHEIEAFQE